MKIAEISKLLFALEYHDEHATLDSAFTQWERILHSLKVEKCWKNGKHCGDCTKEPQTCQRCFVGNIVNKAGLLKYESELPLEDPRAFRLLGEMLEMF